MHLEVVCSFVGSLKRFTLPSSALYQHIDLPNQILFFPHLIFSLHDWKRRIVKVRNVHSTVVLINLKKITIVSNSSKAFL